MARTNLLLAAIPRCVTWFTAAILVSSYFDLAQASYRVVAMSDEVAPGAEAIFLRFGNPVINASGEVAFQAFLSGPTTDVVPHGIWVSSPAALQKVVISGEDAPDVGGARFRTPGPPLILTTDGQTLFYGQLLDQGGVTSDNDYGIWAGHPANLQLVARKSDPAPGLPQGVNYSLFFASPHSSGVIGLTASLQGPGVDSSNNSAAWIGPMTPTGSLQLIARAGETAPGLPAGSRFNILGAPWVNIHGQIAVGAGAFTNDVPALFIPGIWAGVPNDLKLLTAANSPAPGSPGRAFSYFGEPRISGSGHVAFMGYLNADTSEQQISDVGIWVGAADGSYIQPVAIEGQPAPAFGPNAVFRGSTPGDETYYNPFSTPVLGKSGRVAFSATVFGNGIDFDHNDGVWLSDPANDSGPPALTLLAREGDHPPGTPEGTRFVGLFLGDDLISAFEQPLLASTGQVAFEALTTGPLGQFGRGIWATGP